jgi:hypothetical protein
VLAHWVVGLVFALGVCSAEMCSCVGEKCYVVCIKTLQLLLLTEVQILSEDEVNELQSQQKLKMKHRSEYFVSVSTSE